MAAPAVAGRRSASITTALILTLALQSAVPPFATDMYTPAFPRVTADLQTEASLVGLTMTTFFVGMAFDLRNVSSFWRANEEQTPALAAFFLASAQPDYLRDAPGGAARLAASAPVLDRGKDVFAERCARCHSSKTPPLPDSVAGGTCAGGGNGPQYLDCWNKYWEHTKTPEFKEAMKAIVRAPDFLQGNFLSSERRVPVTLLETNACSPLATNALEGNIWDNFSSQTYKDLPSVGTITVYNPVDGKEIHFPMPAGRPRLYAARLADQPVVDGAVPAEQLRRAPSTPIPRSKGASRRSMTSIRQMLWPERRQKDSLVPEPARIHPADDGARAR